MQQIIFIKVNAIVDSPFGFISKSGNDDFILPFNKCKYNYMYNKTLLFIINS